jgi:hypothetical protein
MAHHMPIEKWYLDLGIIDLTRTIRVMTRNESHVDDINRSIPNCR